MSIPEIISLVASIITIITGTISIVVVFTSRVKVVAPPYQGPPPLQQVPTQPAAPWQPSPVYPSVPWQPAPVRSPSRVPQSQSQLGTLQAWLLLSMRYGLPFGVAASLVEYGYVRLLSVLLQGESELGNRFFYLTILQFVAFLILAFLTGLLPAKRYGRMTSSLVAGGAFMLAFLIAIVALFTIDAVVLRMTGGVPDEYPVLLTAISGIVLGGMAFTIFVIPTFITVSLAGLVGRTLYRRRVSAVSR